jgi:hypothetical protein
MKLTVQEAAKLLNYGPVDHRSRGSIDGGSRPLPFPSCRALRWATEHGMATAIVPFGSASGGEGPLRSFCSSSGGRCAHNVETDRESALGAIVKRMPLEDEADRGCAGVMLARER